MDFISKYHLFENLHYCIKTRCTGSPEYFAKKIKKSKRALYDLLNELRDMGAEIRYNKTKQTYYYVNNFELKLLVNFDKEKIIGGKNIFLSAENLHFKFIFSQCTI